MSNDNEKKTERGMQPDFLICGLEHSGTTLLSDLFRQLPDVDAGFEVGVLLRETPRKFLGTQPFSENILGGWGITEAQLAKCCDTDDFQVFYGRLFEAATVLKDGVTSVFDKTPRYLSELDAVRGRCPAPVLICYKDPRATVYSDIKRAKPSDPEAWYEKYKKSKIQYMTNCYRQYEKTIDDPSVLAVALEDLALNARATMEAVFRHVGREFDLRYAVMQDLRYQHTRAKVVSAEIAFEYISGLPTPIGASIEHDFGGLASWFYQ